MQELHWSRRSLGVLGATVLLTASIVPAATAAAAELPTCEPDDWFAPMHVTVDCVDPLYAQPVIDQQVDVDSEVPYHQVSGHFEGTNIEFNIYLHSEDTTEAWDGRFYQSTYPAAFAGLNTAEADARTIAFALSSGAYLVQAGNDSVSIGYRHAAAAAKFAETVAADHYGTDREIYGYLYGASGGSLQTVGAAENTVGIWQGFVPVVQAVPQPSDYNFAGRAAAKLILSDVADDIQDALMPGGSGDPYATLDEAQSALLTEIHGLGIPWKAWEYPEYLFGDVETYYGEGLALGPHPDADTYVESFWNDEGYLGTENSPLGERVRDILDDMGDTATNRLYIANSFYYRYHLPPESAGWVGLDQFRDADGNPLYPQGAPDPGFAGYASGNAAFDGSVTGKMIAVANLYDSDALPLHTDWYRQQVEASLGSDADDAYRVYFNDHADHQGAPTGERAKHLIDSTGIVEQALRDVAAWAEDGVAAPRSTRYRISEGQVVVPQIAHRRGGLQPVVDLGSRRDRVATVEVGERLRLNAVARTPRDGGKIVRVEWDFDGDGVYVEEPVRKPKRVVSSRATHVFDEPGTYFVAVKVSSEREGNADTPYALVQNIDRMRVVVTE